MMEATVQNEARLEEARVLVELGELTQAEAEVAAILEESADDLDTLRLFSKIKHMRGQLSLALACYAQLQARGTNPGESARLHLESMLRMAQDPERGAGEFLAVGQRLVQKPAAYLALEEAFRMYVARRLPALDAPADLHRGRARRRAAPAAARAATLDELRRGRDARVGHPRRARDRADARGRRGRGRAHPGLQRRGARLQVPREPRDLDGR